MQSSHLAPSDTDHLDVPRVLYRTTITGDIPGGVDGFRSQSIQGEFFGTAVPTALKQRLAEIAGQASPVAEAATA